MSLVRLGFVPVLGLVPLLSFGCSDPVPPTPRAAFIVRFSAEGPDGVCTKRTHDGVMGKVDANSKERVIVDGTEGATVDCTVSGSGSFNVSAEASNGKGDFLSINVKGLSTGMTRDAPATGSAAFRSPVTAGEPAYSSREAPCTFWFAENTDEGVGAGKVWVAFECPSMEIDGETCAITESFAIFENCET